MRSVLALHYHTARSITSHEHFLHYYYYDFHKPTPNDMSDLDYSRFVNTTIASTEVEKLCTWPLIIGKIWSFWMTKGL